MDTTAPGGLAGEPSVSSGPVAKSFSFDTYDVAEDFKTLHFHYRITFEGRADVTLTETMVLPLEITDTSDTSLHRILSALHIGLGISYYKTFLPPEFEAPIMSQAAADFWNRVYVTGLGEFLYINQLPAARIARFAGNGPETSVEVGHYDEKAILGIGGGKDSIVAGELLKSIGVEPTAFILGTGEHAGQAQAVADVMGIGSLHVGRKLDPLILELNKEPGAYNGHVPISMVFALTGVLLAHLEGAAYVVVANEASASLPQTTWEDNPVNHQWSKSYEFESLFQQYAATELVGGITYFSAVRPLTSVGVAKLFSEFSRYFEVFTSDNSVFSIDPAQRPSGRWSLASPKSLSSYILLAPWLTAEDLSRTFTIHFMNQPELESLFLELTGIQGHPPLDCVGTVPEIVASLRVAAEQGKFDGSHLLEAARQNGLLEKPDSAATALAALLALQPEHAFPESLKVKLLNALASGLNPDAAEQPSEPQPDPA